MKRHANAARDLAAILADASPDVAAANAHLAEQLRQAADVELAALPAQGERAERGPEPPSMSEHDEQCLLFAWAAAAEAQHPELAMLFAIPNGGARHPAVAAQLKAEGVRPGVPDVFLPAVRPGPDGRVWGGLFVEMKRADHSNGPTPDQRRWIDALRRAGYMAVVCYGAQEAINTIKNYLNQGGRG